MTGPTVGPGPSPAPAPLPQESGKGKKRGRDDAISQAVQGKAAEAGAGAGSGMPQGVAEHPLYTHLKVPDLAHLAAGYALLDPHHIDLREIGKQLEAAPDLINVFRGQDAFVQALLVKLQVPNLSDEEKRVGLRIVCDIGSTIKTLDLSRLRLINDDVLGAYVTTFPNLEVLTLPNCERVTDAGLQELAKLKSLKCVSLADCSAITDITPLLTLPNLTELYLTGCRHLRGFERLPKCEKLQILDLTDCEIGNGAVRAITAMSPQLKGLTLSKNRGITIAALADIATLSGLEELNLSGCEQVAGGFEPFEKLTKLRRLELANCSHLGDPAVRVLASKCPQLEEINFSDCHDLTNQAIEHLASHCNKLTAIDVSFCHKLTSDAVVELARNCHWLKSIALSGCHLIDDRAVEAICENCPELERLVLAETKIGERSLHNIAKQYPHLDYLNLLHCKNIGYGGIQHIARHCPELTGLKFDSNHYTFDNVLDITKCHKLEVLEVGVRGLTDAHLRAISANCPELTHFTAWAAKCTEAGLHHFISQLPHLESIGMIGIGSPLGAGTLNSAARERLRNAFPNVFVGLEL